MSEDYLSLKREISMLRTQLQGVESRSRQTWTFPSIGGGNSLTVYYLECLDGNLLFTASAVNYYGIKRPSAVVTEVPSVTPPATAGGCPDGLSRAQLIASNGSVSTVWVGLRLKPGIWSGGSIIAGSATYDDFPGAIPSQNTFISKTKVQMPVTGSADTYVTVYNPWRV